MSRPRSIGFFKTIQSLDDFPTQAIQVEQKQSEIQTLLSSFQLPSQIIEKEKLLEEKERQLHTLRRAARDSLLNDVLGELGLPGGITTGVKGIAISYDKIEFGSKEIDHTTHQLQDHLPDTAKLQKEINELKQNIKQLRTQVRDQHTRRILAM